MEIFNFSNYTFDPHNLFLWSSLSMSIFSLLSMLTVFFSKVKERKLVRVFSFMSLVSFFTSTFYSIQIIANNAQVALFGARGFLVSCSYAPFSIFYFLLLLGKEREKKYWRDLKIMLGLACLWTICAFTPYFVISAEHAMIFHFWPRVSWIIIPYVITCMVEFSYCLYFIIKKYREVQYGKILKKQLKVVLIGFSLTIICGSSLFFLWVGIYIPPYPFFLASAYVFAAAYAIYRYKLFRITTGIAAESIVNTLGDILFVVGKDGLINIVNPLTLKLFGLKNKEMTGRPISDFLSDASRMVKGAFSEEKRENALRHTKESFLNVANEKMPVSVSLGIIYKSKFIKTFNNLAGFVFICHDVSDMKHKIEIIEKQKNELEQVKKDLENSNMDLEVKVKERTKELEELSASLEQKVKMRTVELEKAQIDLQKKLRELEKFQSVSVGRELKMIELKKKIRELQTRLEEKN